MGCEPTNTLAYIVLDELPRANGAIDFASFDLRKAGNRPLSIVKLIDNFEASYDCVANEGSVFTFHSNLGAPRYKYVLSVFFAGEAGSFFSIATQSCSALRCGLLLVIILRIQTPHRNLTLSSSPLDRIFFHVRRIIRTDISKPSPPETWEAVIPEHATDLLMWAAASKVRSLAQINSTIISHSPHLANDLTLSLFLLRRATLW